MHKQGLQYTALAYGARPELILCHTTLQTYPSKEGKHHVTNIASL